MNTGRKRWVDGVRGAAIILVVLGHLDIGDNPLCKWISSFHVPLFFVISGVLAGIRGAYEGKPLRDVALYKAKQYLYPFVTFSVLAMIYYAFARGAAYAGRIALLTVILEGYSALWFLPAMWMAECIFLALLRCRVPDWMGTAALAIGTSVYSALQYYVIGGADVLEQGIIFQIGNGLCRAGVGAVFMMAGYKGWKRFGGAAHIGGGKAAVSALAAFAVGFACCWLNGMPDMHYCVQHHPLLYYLSALLQSGALIVLFACFIPRCRVLEFFGRNSLIVMATHYPLPLIHAALWLAGYAATGMRYADDLLACAVTMALEAAVILTVNRFAPFLLRMPEKRKAG